MPVMINPSGTVYNPVSVSSTLDTITGGEKCDPGRLYKHGDTWISFDHHTDFSSGDPGELIERINSRSGEARKFLSAARFLFITFGTARIYRFRETGKVVSNCHKIPAGRFTQELLSPENIANMWSSQLERLDSLFPDLKVVFTISPVRHWKDGAHGNHVSKSVLFLAVEELLKHPSRPDYFPAYELVMDDLRDYRFYDEDMLQPSASAIEYIWRAFTGCYFSKPTLELWNEVNKITKAFSHRIREGSGEGIRKFAERSLLQIESVKKRIPSIDLEKETEYFRSLQQLNHL